MSLLTLIRHGQASYMELDYDKLSSAGEEQARKLGTYWVRHGITFDRICTGPAKRHRHTTEIAGEIVQAAGLRWPEPQVIPEFDEFDAFTVMRAVLPVMIEREDDIRSLNEAFQTTQHTPEGGRHLQKLFEAVARKWSTGAFDVPGPETFAEFRTRIEGAVNALRSSAAPSTNTAVFTSGGPIAATVGLTLELDALRTVEFVWLSRNCSYSQFLFSGDRMSLHAYNAIPHLDDLKLLTYR